MKKISLILLMSICGYVYADQNIEIVGGNSAGNPKLAIVSFANESGNISDELTNDFKVTGEFNVLNYANVDSVESGVQYSISGAISETADGQMQIKYKLTNLLTNQVMLDQTAAFNGKFLRKAVHAVSNNIYQKLTNTPGAFTSKIALTVEETPKKYAIIVADYDGYNPKTVLTTSHPITSLSWDKSGQYLSYVTYETGKPVVYVQNIQSGNRYTVANFNGSNSSPVFLSNSQKLLVTLSKDYGSHIYMVNNSKYTGTSQATPVVNFGTIDTEADISNNGKVLFTTDHDGGPQIFMTDLNGSSPTRITQGLGKYNTTARFSNDGGKITFINRNNGVFQTYVMDLTTQAAYPVSPNAHHDVSPSFSPNDKLVLFSSDDTMYISNATGTTLTKLNNLNYMRIIDQRWAKNF